MLVLQKLTNCSRTETGVLSGVEVSRNGSSPAGEIGVWNDKFNNIS